MRQWIRLRGGTTKKSMGEMRNPHGLYGGSLTGRGIEGVPGGERHELLSESGPGGGGGARGSVTPGEGSGLMGEDHRQSRRC